MRRWTLPQSVSVAVLKPFCCGGRHWTCGGFSPGAARDRWRPSGRETCHRLHLPSILGIAQSGAGRGLLKRFCLIVALALVVAGCDPQKLIEDIVPRADLDFADDAFALLRNRDVDALEAKFGPEYRSDTLRDALKRLAEEAPTGAPIKRSVTQANVSIDNGFETTSLTLSYQFESGWFQLFVLMHGEGGRLWLEQIDMQPMATQPGPASSGFGDPAFFVGLAIFAFVLVMAGVAIYQSRARKLAAAPFSAAPFSAARLRQAGVAARAPQPALRATWFRQQPFVIHSPLARAECVRRLQESVRSEWALFSSKPVGGKVTETSISISKMVFYRNSFQTILSGRILDDGAGTRIEARLGFPRRSMILFVVFILAIGVVLPVTAVSLSEGGFSHVPLGILEVPLFFFAFGVFVFVFGRFLARNEGEFLLDFLRSTIDAEVEPADPVEKRPVEKTVTR